MTNARLVSFEKKWMREGKTAAQKAKLRYYYRNRNKILSQYRSVHGIRNEFGVFKPYTNNRAVDL